MKIIKMNRRWKQFKEQQHQVAIRFNSWTEHARLVENKLRELTNTSGWSRDSDWYSYFGKTPDSHGPRPYYITMRNESLMSAILLSVDVAEVK